MKRQSQPPLKRSKKMPAFDSPGESSFFSTLNSMWPDLAQGRAPISPPRNGVDRHTGKMLSGWDHTEQSMEIIFETPFHERVLRRWVGSFVPLILGRSMVERIITRFFWAIASALDLWEPGYKIKQVHFMGNALQQWSPSQDIGAPELIRMGHAVFRQEGVWYPRGHLGDYTPFAGRLFDYSAQGISGQ